MAAFWTNRRFALLLVLLPFGCAIACFVLMAMVERGIGIAQPGLFKLTSIDGWPIGVLLVIAWQIPLILLSGAAALLGRPRGVTVIVYCIGAGAHVLVTFWGVWAVSTSHDAQAPIGLIFIPFYSGLAGWFVAIVSFGVLLLIRWIRRARNVSRRS